MSDNTTHLTLPYVANKQAQRHIFHDEAMRILDALVMLSVIDRDLSAPPVSPAGGDRYLVKPTGTGAFAGKDNRIAHFSDGAWFFYAPSKGWLCHVADESALLAWDGSAWQPALSAIAGLSAIQNLALLGVGTIADATNPLSAKLNNALWTAKTVAEGGDGNLRYKLSKESAAKTLSFLLQDNFSGRAEIGLTGDDDFHLKVSPDGSTWFEAMNVSRSTGKAKILLADAMLGFGMINGVLTASVASNNLTVAIKTKAGSDPSASDPVNVVFRNATAASGDYTVLTLTAATSFTINSGATLGSANATPFRLWVVGFNDAGTFRLGLVNCSNAGAIYPLDEHNARSSTGGTGGNTAGAFYTGTAVTAKAFRIVGYLEWSSGLATAGIWASGPTAIQLFGPGVKKPGDVVQVVSVTTASLAATTSSGFQNSNATLSIAPVSAANLIEASASGDTFCGASDFMILQLHRGGTALAGTLRTIQTSSTLSQSCIAMACLDAPGTTSAITYVVKIRSNGGNSVGFPASSAQVTAKEIMG